MKDKVNNNVSHLKLVKEGMQAKRWTAAELSRRSGVPTGNLSRYLNEVMGMSDDNLFAVLLALDLISNGEKQGETCEVNCGKKISELCKKVKGVVESNTHWGASLEANIHSFKAGLEGDEERKEMKKDMNELKKSNAALSSERPKKDIGKKKAM